MSGPYSNYINLWLIIFKFSAQAWANVLGIKNAKVYKISGFTKVGEYDIVEGETTENTKNDQHNTPDTEELM